MWVGKATVWIILLERRMTVIRVLGGFIIEGVMKIRTSRYQNKLEDRVVFSLINSWIDRTVCSLTDSWTGRVVLNRTGIWANRIVCSLIDRILYNLIIIEIIVIIETIV